MGRTDKLSIFLSLVLRHNPDAANIKVDEHGWADVTELIMGINNTGRKINRSILEEIVRNDKKQRYSFNKDKTKIRANQGHSISVDVELIEKEPPEILFHGTAERFLNNIMTEGLKPMGRLYVHLSKNADTALHVGKRHGTPVVLKINSGAMYQNGVKFFISENNVWLTEKVDVDYIIL